MCTSKEKVPNKRAWSKITKILSNDYRYQILFGINVTEVK